MSVNHMIHRLTLAGLATLSVLATGLVVAVAPSTAALGYLDTPNSVFGASGSGNGQFSSPSGVAVDDSSGDVYVVDKGNNRVEKFSAEGTYISQLNGSGTLPGEGKAAPTGQFSEPYSVAVDNATDAAEGDLYVTDTGHGVIDVFSSSGAYVSQITGTPEPFSGLKGVAVDAFGNVLVYDRNNVDEFSDAGSFVSKFTTGRGPGHGFAVDSDGDVYLLFESGSAGKYTPTGTQLAEWGSGTALAVNQSTNNVFLDTDSKIEEFGPFAEPYGGVVGEFGSGLSSSEGIAVNDTTGTFYASGSGADTVAIFKAAVFPEAAGGAVSKVKATSAKLEGVVNPGGEQVTNCQFEYGNGHIAPCTPAPGNGTSPVNVSAELTDLEPNTTYQYRLIVTNANGTVHGANGTFATEAIVPLLSQQLPVAGITRTSATLFAKLNPENGATTYRVLYGTTSSYGQHTIEVMAGDGFGEETIDAGLTGLTPNTTYHYVFVATNPTGSVVGPEETFTTGSPTPPTVTTGGASGITLTAAMVSGTINPEGLVTSYELDLGTDTTYGTSIYGEVGSGGENVGIDIALQDLAPSTTYHYRLVAINSDGRTYGADETFTTPAYSKPIVLPSALPLLQTPAIVFPAETRVTVVKSTKKATKAKKKVKAKGKKKAKVKGKKKPKKKK